MNNLLAKSIAGLVFLLLVLGILLFVSAGTVQFWQAWLYLVVFAICVILITAYLAKYDQRLLASRVAAGPVAETQKSQQIIQSLAGLLFMVVIIVAGLDFRFHWSIVSPILSVIADGFVILGFYFVFRVFKENTYTSAVIEVAAEQKVISTGPYSLVRHPMYAGAAILLIFTPLALGSWVALPLPILLMLSIAARAVEEEKFLRTNLAGYERYTQKVRYRIIPFIW